MEEEVGALLGSEVKLQNLENRMISKETFFYEELSGKQVVAYMDVVGELENASYLFVGLKDAIHIGGTLIMLPQSELDSVVNEETFGDDTQDAYGEIANIIAGVYSAVFEEQYIKKIRFVKTGLEQIVPMKVKIEARCARTEPAVLYEFDVTRDCRQETRQSADDLSGQDAAARPGASQRKPAPGAGVRPRKRQFLRPKAKPGSMIFSSSATTIMRPKNSRVSSGNGAITPEVFRIRTMFRTSSRMNSWRSIWSCGR